MSAVNVRGRVSPWNLAREEAGVLTGLEGLVP